jgi:hypothetical protein
MDEAFKGLLKTTEKMDRRDHNDLCKGLIIRQRVLDLKNEVHTFIKDPDMEECLEKFYTFLGSLHGKFTKGIVIDTYKVEKFNFEEGKSIAHIIIGWQKKYMSLIEEQELEPDDVFIKDLLEERIMEFMRKAPHNKSIEQNYYKDARDGSTSAIAIPITYLGKPSKQTKKITFKVVEQGEFQSVEDILKTHKFKIETELYDEQPE